MDSELVPCPLCGADINANASACRHCGSDIDSWNDEYDDQPDFDYDDFIANEFPDHAAGHYTNTQTRPFWRLVAVILLVLFLFGYAVI